MTEEVQNYQVDRKYRVTFEQVASTKGVLGFKVEANGDDLDKVKSESVEMLLYAINETDKLSKTTNIETKE